MPSDPTSYRGQDSEEYAKWEGDAFPSSKLEEIEAWASKELAASKSTAAQESHWEMHGALQAFQLCDNEDEKKEISQRRAKKALELNPQNWHACHFVSGLPTTSTSDGLALLRRTKNAVDETRAEDETWMDDSANTALLARITLDLGNKLWELGDYSSAALHHRESLEYDYVRFSTYVKVLGRYQERQQWDEFIAFIETLNRTSNIWHGYFDELVNDFINTLVDNDSDMLAQAADATNQWDAIRNFFEIAEAVGNRRHAHDLLFLLRDGFARTLELTSGVVDENSVITARVAALETIRAHPSNTLPQTRIYKLTDMLALVYLDKAFRPNTSEEKIESLGSSLSALLPDVSDGMDAWDNITTVCCIIRYDYKRHAMSRSAKSWIERIVRTGLELLSDSDEGMLLELRWLNGHLDLQTDTNKRHR
jgi:hypothetical protein